MDTPKPNAYGVGKKISNPKTQKQSEKNIIKRIRKKKEKTKLKIELSKIE